MKVVECDNHEQEIEHVAAETLHYMEEEREANTRKYSDIAVRDEESHPGLPSELGLPF